MSKLLPIILIILGLGGGVGAGLVLRPDPAQKASLEPCSENEAYATLSDEAPKSDDAEQVGSSNAEYVKLANQFVVPVVLDERISALVVMSLSLQIAAGSQETVYSQEPKLRDSFLQVLFDHANTGGFDGAFTAGANMNALRKALLEVAQKTLGKTVEDVLIVDVVRQDV